ncbi:hypothetical protein ACJX0J_014608, partial [Zea mays]
RGAVKRRRTFWQVHAAFGARDRDILIYHHQAIVYQKKMKATLKLFRATALKILFSIYFYFY